MPRRDVNVRKSFLQQAQAPAGGAAEQYSQIVREDSDKLARLVKQLNITVQ